jgi:hypothetical protein
MRLCQVDSPRGKTVMAFTESPCVHREPRLRPPFHITTAAGYTNTVERFRVGCCADPVRFSSRIEHGLTPTGPCEDSPKSRLTLSRQTSRPPPSSSHYKIEYSLRRGRINHEPNHIRSLMLLSWYESAEELDEAGCLSGRYTFYWT